MRGRLSGLDRPLLIIHGARDRLCPVEQAHKIAAEAGDACELVVYEEGVHVCNNIPFPVAAPRGRLACEETRSERRGKVGRNRRSPLTLDASRVNFFGCMRE